jgi:uncharacterized protein
LTDRCNLRCPYCYQKRRDRTLSFSDIKKALEFLQANFQRSCYIGFYGGEPLLASDTIRKTLSFIESHDILKRKEFRYSISTNGSILTEEMMSVLSTHRFRINLSYDGTAQETTRPSRINAQILENLDRLVRLPGIEFYTNSVFTPDTAAELFRSARFLIDRGVKNCHLTTSFDGNWDPASLDQIRKELRKLLGYLQAYYRRYGAIPVENFQSRPVRRLLWCSAGQDRLSLNADGKVWGCRYFGDFFADREELPGFNEYCFGVLDDFTANLGDAYKLKSRNYEKLGTNQRMKEKLGCKACAYTIFCSVCPATVAFSTGVIGEAPAWFCEMNRIWHGAIRDFWEAVEKN